MDDKSGQTATGAEILIDALKKEGVEITFGYPGGKIIPVFDALKRAEGIDLLLTRHEQAATHAADGYARATGKVGVCIVTSGPGATNTVTGIATAKMDSVPMVIICGQVATSDIGSDAFQEADLSGLGRTLCKHNYLVERVGDLPQIVKNAFHIAGTGRPGPVLIDLPVDVMTAKLENYVYPDEPSLSVRGPATGGPDPSMLDRLAEAVAGAERPLVLAGGGIIISGAGAELAAFLEKTSIPAAVTMMGLGCLPSRHPLNLGMPGMHGEAAANYAITECDLLIGLGTRFDDRVTSVPSLFAPRAKVAHIDIDPSELGKIVRADFPITGDVRAVLAALIERTAPRGPNAWNERVAGWRKEHVPDPGRGTDGRIDPTYVIGAIDEAALPGTIITTDVGQHQMWAALGLDHRRPRAFITSGGMGTMGFGLPAAMGACLGRPDSPVVCITGDGSIQMNIQELATCAVHRLPVKIVVLNNSCLGLVRQWQELFWDGNYSKTCLKENTACAEACRKAEGDCPNAYWPDLVKVAEGNGMRGLRVSRPSDLAPALEESFAAPGPVLIDVMVDKFANVYPMVSAGRRLDEIIFGRM